MDVTKPDIILFTGQHIEKKQEQLDVFINNADINGSLPQSALESSIENFKEVLGINLYGVVRTTQAFIDLLKKSSEPRIVNISTSVGSLRY